MVINAKTEVHKYYDSTVKTLPAEKVKIPVPVTFTVPVPVNVKIDTNAILQSYFNVNYYSQVIQDSAIRAIIKDSIAQNKIHYRNFSYQLLQPFLTTETTTIITNDPKRIKLLAGAFIEAGQNNLSGYGPAASIQLKNGDLISASYDLKKHLFNNSPTFELTMQFNLFKNARINNKNK